MYIIEEIIAVYYFIMLICISFVDFFAYIYMYSINWLGLGLGLNFPAYYRMKENEMEENRMNKENNE